METSHIKRNLMNKIYKLDSNTANASIKPVTNSLQTSPRTSLSPCSSEKSLKFRPESITETSQGSFSKFEDPHKPISLVIIEKYFSDVCHSIANKAEIDSALLSKANTMQEVLKDCLTALPELSLQFYVLMASSLKEIQQINLTKNQSLYTALSKKLVQLADMIEKNNYTSETERAMTQPNEEILEGFADFNEIGKELNIRMARVTARILNIWKKILSPQREAAVISCGFLLLYCEVDSSLKILPDSRIPIDKAIVSMKGYLSNPGHVVTVIRKTKEFVEKEMISVETIRRIHDLLGKVTVDQVKNSDKTMTALTIYELIVFAVRFYQSYAKKHYKIDIFEKSESENEGFRGIEEAKLRVIEGKSKENGKVYVKFQESPIKSGETPQKNKEPTKQNYESGPKVQEKFSKMQETLKNKHEITVKSINFSPGSGVSGKNPNLPSKYEESVLKTPEIVQKTQEFRTEENLDSEEISMNLSVCSFKNPQVTTRSDKTNFNSKPKSQDPASQKFQNSRKSQEFNIKEPISKRILNSSDRSIKTGHSLKSNSHNNSIKIGQNDHGKYNKQAISSIKPIFNQNKAKITHSHSINQVNNSKPAEKKTVLGQSPSNFVSPDKSPNKTTQKIPIEAEKTLDKNIIAAKRIISNPERLANSSKTTPVRNRINIKSPRSNDQTPLNRDVLEEMQYQQFIEEKFRHYLIEKLRKENEKLIKSGLEKNDAKIVNEIKALKSKNNWIDEFEKNCGIIRYNSTKKLYDEKRFTAELIRAQKQLEILERYSNE